MVQVTQSNVILQNLAFLAVCWYLLTSSTVRTWIVEKLNHSTYFFVTGLIPVVNIWLSQHFFGNYWFSYDLCCFILWIIKFLFYPQQRHKRLWILCVLSHLICILFLYITFIINIIFGKSINKSIQSYCDPFPLIICFETCLLCMGYYTGIFWEIPAVYKFFKLNHDDKCTFCYSTWKETNNMNILILWCGHEYHASCWNDYENSNKNNDKFIIRCAFCNYEPNEVYQWRIYTYQHEMLKFIVDKSFREKLQIIKLKCVLLFIQIIPTLKYILSKMHNIYIICMNKSKYLCPFMSSRNSSPINIDSSIVDLQLQQQSENLFDNNNNNNNDQNNNMNINNNNNHNSNQIKRKKKKRKQHNKSNKNNSDSIDTNSEIQMDENEEKKINESLSNLGDINEIEIDNIIYRIKPVEASNVNFKACNKCTYHNHITAKKCIMCDNAFVINNICMNKKVNRKRVKYWICVICGIKNKNIILQCKCGAHKPIKEWEWNCHVCTTRNHINNVKCQICKQERIINNKQCQCIDRCQKVKISKNKKKKKKKNKRKKMVNNNVLKPLYLCDANVPPPPKRAPPDIPMNRYYGYGNDEYFGDRRSDFDVYDYESNEDNEYNKYNAFEYTMNERYVYNNETNDMDCMRFKMKEVVYFKKRKCEIVYIDTQCKPRLYTVKYVDTGKCEKTNAMHISIRRPTN